MKAKDIVITVLEFELMWKEATRAYEDYESKSIKDKLITIPVQNPGTLEGFIESRMNEFAKISWGDTVLLEGDKEIKRVKANFQKEEVFRNGI